MGRAQRSPGPFAVAEEGVQVPGARHALLDGFEETNLLPFGGRLEAVALIERDGGKSVVPARFVAPCPVYPPETAWMRGPQGTLPALVAQEHGGRTVYLAADLDRCYARNPQPDYARLLVNAALWVLGSPPPLLVSGPGLLDCRLFRQVRDGRQRHVLHIVNLSGTEPRPACAFLPVGPLEIRLAIPAGQSGRARLLVSGQETRLDSVDGWLHLRVERVVDHEVIVIE
jgi:hypothetical protein